jgi:hypothetical protein
VPLRRGRAGIARPCAPGGRGRSEAANPALRPWPSANHCLSRSAGGPRPKRCTKSAPWRSRHRDRRQLALAAWLPSPSPASIVVNNRTGWWVALGYRSRLSSTVPTTEATTENRIISRQPGQAPRGRICARPGRTGWLLGLQGADRSRIGPCPVADDRSASDYVRGNGMAGPWRRLLPGHATPPAVVYDLVRRRRRVWAPRS